MALTVVSEALVNQGPRRRFERTVALQKLGQLLWIHVVAGVVDIDKQRPGPEIDDRTGGRVEGVRNRYHGIARSNAQGLKREQQGVGSGSHAHGVGQVAKARDLLFQSRYLAPQDEMLAFQNLIDRGANLLAHHGVLSLEIEQRNFHCLEISIART